MVRSDRPSSVRLASFFLLLALAVGACVCGDEDASDGYPDQAPYHPDGGDGGCTGSCVDEPTSCGFEGDPRCRPSEACTVPAGTSCEAPEGCLTTASCAPATGGVPGLYGCSTDADCASGRCVAGACLWVCSTDADCPGQQFACRTRELGDGVQVLGCTGVDLAGTELLGLHLCRSDAGCAEGDVCRILAMPGNAALQSETLARCVPEVEAGETRLGAGCVHPRDCRSGLCALPCDASGGLVRVCGDFRCSQPCATDADCSSPYVCGGTLEGSGVGGRTVSYCTLPEDGCFDDASCCPETSPGGTCTGGYRVELEVCRIEQGPAGPRQLCRAPGTLQGRFEPCATDGDCASRLCVAGECSSPCVPEKDACDSTEGGGSCVPTPDGPGAGRCIEGDICGDGFRTGLEACDGTDVGAASCGAPGGGITDPWCSPTCTLDESPCGCTNDSACPHGPCDAASSACGCWHSVGPAEIETLALCLTAAGDELMQSPFSGAVQTAAEFCASVGAGPCISTEDVSCGPGSCDAPVQSPGMVLCRCVP